MAAGASPATGTPPRALPGGTAPATSVAAGTAPDPDAGGIAAATSVAAGTAPDADVGGTAADAESTTAAGGVDALAGGMLVTTFVDAGGTVTDAGGVPAVTDVLALCNDSVTLPGFEAICCRMLTHGTPGLAGAMGLAAAVQLNSRTAPHRPPVATAVATERRTVSDMGYPASQASAFELPPKRIRRGGFALSSKCGFIETMPTGVRTVSVGDQTVTRTVS
ncbi:hypothetical protein MCNF_23320 [Mycolicibacterium confluentis]|uniref:Uncharacterized protein n=1 Tax=Mycolicibacterium confluentis TaxID=28047 RepID=A0A7I7XWV0_9MYCO|nr:hypothetical protein MCNF_23320 [Mycolicibacterium confluentis]